ncbi:hypothetical protein A2U01_0064923, partial [Trifolium medium]|nr:hypothetical protein [Trifolium medium]
TTTPSGGVIAAQRRFAGHSPLLGIILENENGILIEVSLA